MLRNSGCVYMEEIVLEEVQLGGLLSLLTATLSHAASWSFMHRGSGISQTEQLHRDGLTEAQTAGWKR